MDDLDPQLVELIRASWFDAYASARKSVESLREIYPELTSLLEEAASYKIKLALNNAQDAINELYAAGPDIFGETDWQAIVLEHREWRKNG